MDPDQTTPIEPAPLQDTPPTEPVVVPETPPEPQPVIETPTATSSANVEPQPPLPPITPVDIPIPNFRFPFNGEFPVTFAFDATPTTDEMKGKFAQWRITGHHGIDFGLPEGTEVVAVDSGTVLQSSENGDYGNSVTIQHPWGQSLYAHLKETKVSEDQAVKAGDLIGLSGQTGAAFGAHLHFGIKPNNPNESNGYLGFIDPTQYLPQIPQTPQEPKTIQEPIHPAPQPVPIEPKPEEPKPVVETPPIPEPTINIEPVGIPSQPPQPSNLPDPVASDEEIQQRAEELLKEKQATFRVLGNQAKTKEREDNLTKILQYAQEKKQIDNQQVRDLLHVSQSTATNYLTELVNKGQLRMDKKAKATVYNY